MTKSERFKQVLTGLATVFVVTLLLCLQMFTVVSSSQEDQLKDGRYYEALARKAYQQKDYVSFLENMRLAAELRPNHPRLMYNLAAAYALTGQGKEALLWLAKVARMGLVYPAESDPDFESIKSADEFKAILKRFQLNREPTVKSVPAFVVHEKGLIPESIALDPETANFYVGSVYRRKIVRIDSRGEASDFVTERDGLWSVMGMKVDARRRHLWACTTAHPQMSNFLDEDRGKTALFKIDLRTGKILKKYYLPNKPQPHWLGDLIVNSRGDVFATDSISPAVYLLRHDRDELESLIAGEPLVSPQGLDFTPDEKSLFVADYAKGIFLINPETKQWKAVAPAPDTTLLGIDGLYSYKGSLIGIQNGVNPQRLIRLFLSKDFSRVERSQIIEANNPVFDEPTLGVLVKNQFYFIANSQWGAIDQKGNLAPPEKLKEPVILRLGL